MSKNELIIKGKHFPLNYNLLCVIADNVQTGDLIQALIDLDIPSITKTCLDREFLLPSSTADEIWASGDIDLRESLLSGHQAFRENLTDKQARDILENGTSDMMYSLAKNCDDLFPYEEDDDEDDEDAWKPRLSEKMREKLIIALIENKDPKMRIFMASNTSTPHHLLELLANDPEPDVELAAKVSLLEIAEEDDDAADDEE